MVSQITEKYQAPIHQFNRYIRDIIETEAWPTRVQLKRKT